MRTTDKKHFPNRG